MRRHELSSSAFGAFCTLILLLVVLVFLSTVLLSHTYRALGQSRHLDNVLRRALVGQ